MDANIISCIAVTISAIGLLSNLFFSGKNNKRIDVSDIERRASENTKMNLKLDEVINAVNDIRYDISATRKDVQLLAVDVASLQSSYKSEHKRIDRLERVLDLKREELDDDEVAAKR